MLGCILPFKLHSYPQFIQEAQKQIFTSCNKAQQYLRAQHLHNKEVHDNTAVQLCIGDRVQLYTPVVSKDIAKTLLHAGMVPIQY